MELYHYGMPRRSGRYPWGSGENPYQRDPQFLSRINDMKRQGLTEKERADLMGMTIAQLRNEVSLATQQDKAEKRALAVRLSQEGKGPSEIARIMGLPNESSARSLLNAADSKKHAETEATISVLAKNVSDKKYIDVGHGVAEGLGISETRLKTAVQALEDQGYTVQKIHIPQVSNPKQYTTIKVLAAPGVERSEIYANKDKIGTLNERFTDPHSTSLYGLKPIQSISSKKVQICYGDEGGAEKDGVIELRRGAEGLSLGQARYAQVRIGVDGTHYLKGMAIYADDLPDGVDIRFNTNKKSGTPASDVFKKMKDDPDNPFGAVIKPGGQKGYLNIVREEGNWADWNKSLAAQMLSKQPKKLAEQQLGLSKLAKKQEFDEIMSITNPVLKQHMLDQYADSCDTAARHLKAAALPRQGSHVILPVNSLKPDEIYAPNYKNGETVVLIRYPHGGIFEIPTLRVNNRNAEAKRLFQNAQDAVGIHHSVAERLSGADFDGDTVVVIPNNNRAIKTSPALKGLENFDPKTAYPKYPGMKVISKGHMQKEMGVVSNLITDMTIKDAPQADIAKAVRYSMVVIDSHKHELDYRTARKDNDIDGLQKKYQYDPTKPGDKKWGGASTLISRAKSEERVPERKEAYRADPKTGEKIYIETGRTWTDKNGKVHKFTSTTTKMDNTKDARTLSSGTAIEAVYANYANDMKALANKARKESLATKDTAYSPEARKKYAAEVSSLDAKLTQAIATRPLERKAQLYANQVVEMKKAENPGIERDEEKKIRTQAITEARARLKSKKPEVTITDREWEAIQSGAVSKSKQKRIFLYADQDKLKQRALPKSAKDMTSSKKALAQAKLAAGYTQAEVAESLGVSVSTLKRAIYD